MSKAFTADSFFIFQHSFLIFPINKLDNYPFVVTSAIPWERELMTTLNISIVHIYSSLLTDVNNRILQIFIGDAVRYAWWLYIISSTILLPFCLFLNLLSFPLTWGSLFFEITSSLVSFLLSNEIWSITSVSLYNWSDSLSKSVSTISFPFRSNVFCTKSYFFSEFNTDSEIFKILVPLSPILITSTDVST